MRPARIVLLLVALVAGGLAAFLATRGTGPVTVVEQAAAPQQQPAAQILVAKQAIGVGERLSAAEVEWQTWPADAVRADYITVAKSPDAPAKISGTVARFEIFQGEPILDAKLVHTDQGYLSAVLDPGMRGVSVNVQAASGSGGFIIPNDRVDVVVTDNSRGQTNSRVILSNVKVLAIGTRLGQTGTTGAPADPKSQVFTNDAIATLELTPAEADTLINATAMGKVSLVLRSVADFSKPGPVVADISAPASTAASSAGDSQIKVIRFGRAVNVTPGDTSTQPTVNPAAYVPSPIPVANAPTANTVTPSNADASSTPTATVVTPGAAAQPAAPAAPPVPVQ
jgi:pilus assembly protein CpaB